MSRHLLLEQVFRFFKQGGVGVQECVFNIVLNAQLIALNETYGRKISDVSKKLVADELKVNEDLAKSIATIKENSNKDILKAEEDRASKSKAITEKLIADQQRLNDEYAKYVLEVRAIYSEVRAP